MLYDMTFYSRAIIIAGFAIACSGNNESKKSVTISDTIEPIKKKDPVYLSDIKSGEIHDFNQVPAFIRQYLDTLVKGKYLIANPGESYSAGCTVMEGEPNKQLIEASIDQYVFKMKYWQGGIALMKCLLTLTLDENEVTGYKVDYLPNK